MSKIIVFGDSIMKGIVFNERTKRMETLGESCLQLLSHSGSAIINHSLFGATVQKGLSLFSRYEKEIEQGDVVLLEFGGNDCNFNWKDISEHPEKDHEPKTSLIAFRKTYEALITSIKEKGARPVLLNLPPLHAPFFFKTISASSSASNIRAWLGDVYHIYRWQERYSLEVERIARDLGCTLIDIRGALLDHEPLSKLLCSDGMHPNKEGHACIYKALYEKLSKC